MIIAIGTVFIAVSLSQHHILTRLVTEVVADSPFIPILGVLPEGLFAFLADEGLSPKHINASPPYAAARMEREFTYHIKTLQQCMRFLFGVAFRAVEPLLTWEMD
jgi:hypothetical protein